jgi:hypothetical protein
MSSIFSFNLVSYSSIVQRLFNGFQEVGQVSWTVCTADKRVCKRTARTPLPLQASIYLSKHSWGAAVPAQVWRVENQLPHSY